MRRTILLAVLILVGCSYYHKQTLNTCPGGSAPIVCIDSSLNATPDPVHVKRGQWLHFFLANRDELDIQGDFLVNQGHDQEQAWGRVRKDAEFGRHKYTIINVTTGKRNDPEVMIDP
jgi:hypothetical protein